MRILKYCFLKKIAEMSFKLAYEFATPPRYNKNPSLIGGRFLFCSLGSFEIKMEAESLKAVNTIKWRLVDRHSEMNRRQKPFTLSNIHNS
jgi:hypothetical protein